MAKATNAVNEPRPTKYERVYEDETSIDTWKYDLSKNPNGPIEVDIKYKRTYIHPAMKQSKKYIKDLLKEQKKTPTKK